MFASNVRLNELQSEYRKKLSANDGDAKRETKKKQYRKRYTSIINMNRR